MATSKHHKITRFQGRRGEQTARQREKQAKRDSGARTTALKQSQQPRKPRPRRWPKSGNAIHRKLREKAETLVRPRLKTEQGISPCPMTHSCRKDTEGKNRANKRAPVELTYERRTLTETGRDRGHPSRAKGWPHAEGQKARAEKPKPNKVRDRQNPTPPQLCIKPPRIQRAVGRGGSNPVDSWNSRGKQGLPKGEWLAPRI